jgi:hypothetical protein
MIKIILSFDVEGDFHKYIHSPYIWHKIKKTPEANYYSYTPSRFNATKNYFFWKLNNLRNYASGAEGFKNILSFLEAEQIPASLNLCGYIYTKKPLKIPLKMSWAIGKLAENHYFWEKYINNAPFLDILENINNKNLDFGLHGFIHEAFPLEDNKAMNMILEKSIESGKEMGFDLKTFVPPFNMSFNNNEREVLKIMRKNKISSFRTTGKDDYFGSFSHKKAVEKVKNKNGMKFIYLSDSIEGNYNKEKIKLIIENIIKNYDKNKIYCIMAHDYSFKTNKNLFILMKELRKIQENYYVKFTNLKKL